MLVTVCERIDRDIRSSIDSAHGSWIVSLDPADGELRDLGYARVVVAGPGAPARFDGVAVVVESGWAPDPLQIQVGGVRHPGALCLDREDLPVLLRVDTYARLARVLRSSRVPSDRDDAIPDDAADAGEE